MIKYKILRSVGNVMQYEMDKELSLLYNGKKWSQLKWFIELYFVCHAMKVQQIQIMEIQRQVLSSINFWKKCELITFKETDMIERNDGNGYDIHIGIVHKYQIQKYKFAELNDSCFYLKMDALKKVVMQNKDNIVYGVSMQNRNKCKTWFSRYMTCF